MAFILKLQVCHVASQGAFAIATGCINNSCWASRTLAAVYAHRNVGYRWTSGNSSDGYVPKIRRHYLLQKKVYLKLAKGCVIDMVSIWYTPKSLNQATGQGPVESHLGVLLGSGNLVIIQSDLKGAQVKIVLWGKWWSRYNTYKYNIYFVCVQNILEL